MNSIFAPLRSALVFALMLFAIALTAWSQQPGQLIVKSIEVQYAGPATVSRERILANIRTQVGQPYSEQVVEADIRSLYNTGQITNVRMFGEPSDGGIKVYIVIQAKAVVSEILVEGGGIIKTRRIRKEITAKPGSVLNEDTLEADRQKILELYQKKGYADVGVQYNTELDERTGRTKVTYVISEGGKTVIRHIVFSGNTVFKSKRLLKEMKTRPKNFLSFITSSGKMNTIQLDEDLQKLRVLYQNAGYTDVKIGQPQVQRVSADRVDLHIAIDEGPKYIVNSVHFTGNTIATDEQIRKVLLVKEGAAAGTEPIRKDIKSVEDSYGRLGYADARIDLVTTPAGPGLVNLQYNIEEGGQSYLERVNITGNTRTKDKVIRRELILGPGDVYDTVRVEISKQRIQGLDYFEKVETYASDTMVPGRKDLNINVEEKRTGSLNFGAGFSSIDSILGFVEITQANFDIMNPWAFTGGGQRFRMRLQLGTQRKDFIISLTEPYFLDRRLSLGGDIFYREADYQSNVYSQRNYGFDLKLRKALNNFTQATLEYLLENVSIYDVDESASQAIQDEAGDKLKSQISLTVNNDTRDNLKLTRRGHQVIGTIHYAGGILGGDVETYGLGIEGKQYFRLPWDTILLLNAEVAAIDSWGNGDVPIFDRLYLGGANTLRGFDYRDVGPKDENGEPIGGRTMARFTAEYTFPIVEKVRGALFYDTGFVSEDAWDWGGDVNSDVGIGVRLDLPIGPIRIDYGIPIQADSFNDSSGKFNFNVGYQF
ncbi:MAG TPA: outer membrane protein assembly factor BamA [Chthoniobacterales bacterium]